MNSVDKILQEEGTRLVELLQESLREKGVAYQENDSRLSANIRFKFQDKSGGTAFYLTMPEYWEALDKGRKAGFVPITPIVNWIKRKGLFLGISLKDKRKIRVAPKKVKKELKKVTYEKRVLGFAFAISKSKSKKSTPGNHFYSEVVKDWIPNLESRLKEALKREIEISLVEYGK